MLFAQPSSVIACRGAELLHNVGECIVPPRVRSSIAVISITVSIQLSDQNLPLLHYESSIHFNGRISDKPVKMASDTHFPTH